ncbi:MAG: UDP-glucose 4-epimerase GalE [Erysipelotrichaceae bacterium]|nr:UDP-glucose 4-epimerase GalE [Erysipelotrichaceae bacterium]MBR4122540.1 UDP-glucose 4-epimerase GalE [Erysipelotrichaceae bacterium]
MRVLVTGGTGFIGSHTVVELINAGHEAVIVDNLYNSDIHVLDRIEKITGVRPEFFETDILDFEGLEKVFQAHEYDAIIHFAGYKAVGESVAKPLVYYENNISGSLNLYHLAAKYNVKRIVFSSSATVYGDDFEAPFKEEYGYGTTTNPYGTTKLFNERILTDLAFADKELSAVLLRYFNPIGAHKSGLIGEVPNGIPNNLLPYIAKVANGQLPYLSVFGDDYDTVDGTGVRDYIHVVDLARAHVKALDYAMNHTGAEVINIGTGKGYSVLQVLHAYEKACGKKIPYKIVARRPGDIATCYADPSKAKKLLGFETQYDIEEMCEDGYRFSSQNPDGIK